MAVMDQDMSRLAEGRSPFALGVRGLCPYCGEGHLFSGSCGCARPSS
jgi:uncharacterized protein (DUF983 family)